MLTVERIFQLINENGLTAKEFANKVGVSQGNITDWKTGRARPSIESLQKIAKYTGAQLDWLTGDSEFKTKDEELKTLINFTQQQSGLGRKVVENSFGEGFNLSKEENKIFYEILDKLLDSINNNNIDNFNVFDYLKTQSNISQQKIINALTLLTSSQAQVYSKFMNSHKENEESILDQVSKILQELKSSHQLEENVLSIFYMCPVYGCISAGQPNWAEECIEGRIPLDTELMGIVEPEEYFFFHIEGDEMNKVAKDGAFALIHKQDFVENGEIALVIVDNNDAILRKYTKQGELIILEPISGDPTYSVQAYGSETKIIVLGKYVGKFEMNK